MAAFQVLPYEILDEIFKFVRNTTGRKGLKNLRLTCKYFEAPARPLIFDHISISDKAKDLEVFTKWTSNPALASCIKAIDYHVGPWYPELTREQYTYALMRYLHRRFESEDFQNNGGDVLIHDLLIWRCEMAQRCSCHKLAPEALQDILYEPGSILRARNEARARNPAQVNFLGMHGLKAGVQWPPQNIDLVLNHPIVTEGYQRYLEEASKSAELRTSGRMRDLLTAGFLKCPTNTRHLNFKGRERQKPLQKDVILSTQGPNWRQWFDSDGTSPFTRSWNILYLPTTLVGPNSDSPHLLVSYMDYHPQLIDVLPDLEIVSDGLCKASIVLDRLFMDMWYDDEENGIDHQASIDRWRGQKVSRINPLISFSIIRALNNLKMLKIMIGTDHLREPRYDSGIHGVLGLLPHFPKLEHFELQCDLDWTGYDVLEFMLSDIVPINHHFPALKSLCVEDIMFDADELCTFLHNHPSIRTLNLQCNADWAVYHLYELDDVWRQLSGPLNILPTYEILVPFNHNEQKGIIRWSDKNPHQLGQTIAQLLKVVDIYN
ncbi:hypothetical protein MMC25_007981 [Agyrium rufum]|nr:hypothetical protein [Agyrium rufum]